MLLNSKTLPNIQVHILVNKLFLKALSNLSFFRLIGLGNVMNIPVSPFTAALTVTAAVIFAILGTAFATFCRKRSHK